MSSHVLTIRHCSSVSARTRYRLKFEPKFEAHALSPCLTHCLGRRHQNCSKKASRRSARARRAGRAPPCGRHRFFPLDRSPSTLDSMTDRMTDRMEATSYTPSSSKKFARRHYRSHVSKFQHRPQNTPGVRKCRAGLDGLVERQREYRVNPYSVNRIT
ncbi:hypothetical protein B0H12DRAFT_686826 [Mycena haematopus]|nr:hypothetical protein B0H12DRAFT_686826 [Mycena haematopus]